MSKKINKMTTSKLSVMSMIFTYLSFGLLIAVGYIEDIVEKMKKRLLLRNYKTKGSLVSQFDSFYSRRLIRKGGDCLSYVITGVPGRQIEVLDRYSNDYFENFVYPGTTSVLINFGSYNYLGFANNKGSIIRQVLKASKNHKLILAGPTRDIGTYEVVSTLENEIADFLSKEDAIVFSMGYGTNTSNIPVLFDEGTLVLSDELNHASLITGMMLSKAVVKVFKHNDMADLEKRLVFLLSQGQPITHRAWKKVIVVVEGIYSMEGTIVKLNELVSLKRKYKFYIFIDEAHSIGALGKTGRGVCEHLGVDFSDIDILMGTFTKSFGGMGGYIASSKEVITHLRFYSDFSMYGDQMSPVIAAQVLESLRYIRDTYKGSKKLRRLRHNVKVMRRELEARKFLVLGDKKSPVIPVLISNPGKMGELARICREEGVAIVIVGYPATPLLFGRVRLCMSSSHTKSDIFKTIDVLDKAGDLLGIKYNK